MADLRLIAAVRGFSIVFPPRPHTGWLPNWAATPLDLPKRERVIDAEIRGDPQTGFFLNWRFVGAFEAAPSEITQGDYWLPDLEAALDQAKSSLGIPSDAWHEAP